MNLQIFCFSTILLCCAFRRVLSDYTLKKCWVVLSQFWVKYGQTQIGLKNVI